MSLSLYIYIERERCIYVHVCLLVLVLCVYIYIYIHTNAYIYIYIYTYIIIIHTYVYYSVSAICYYVFILKAKKVKNGKLEDGEKKALKAAQNGVAPLRLAAARRVLADAAAWAAAEAAAAPAPAPVAVGGEVMDVRPGDPAWKAVKSQPLHAYPHAFFFVKKGTETIRCQITQNQVGSLAVAERLCRLLHHKVENSPEVVTKEQANFERKKLLDDQRRRGPRGRQARAAVEVVTKRRSKRPPRRRGPRPRRPPLRRRRRPPLRGRSAPPTTKTPPTRTKPPRRRRRPPRRLLGDSRSST